MSRAEWEAFSYLQRIKELLTKADRKRKEYGSKRRMKRKMIGIEKKLHIKKNVNEL